jgi:flagellar hook assembly protein FlgD
MNIKKYIFPALIIFSICLNAQTLTQKELEKLHPQFRTIISEEVLNTNVKYSAPKINSFQKLSSGENLYVAIQYSNEVEIDFTIPNRFYLGQNYPNPFNPTTEIIYEIASDTWISLKIYDVLGNEVQTLISEEKPAGKYKVQFDGSKLPSGTYFYKIITPNFTDTKKMILLK